MAEAKPKDAPKAKETKDVKPKTTIVSQILEVAAKPSKDRAELVAKVLAQLKAKGITKNTKGRMVTEANTSSLLGAMIRDINDERGKAHDGWWSKMKVVETETLFQIVPR